MKVTRGPKCQFEPITVVLESVKEADLFWHFLNAPNHVTEEAIAAQLSVSNEYRQELVDVSEQMWDKFKVHHKPIGGKDC